MPDSFTISIFWMNAFRKSTENVPRLTEIDNEISSISVASAKQLLSDDGAEDSSVLSSLKEQLAALRREKQNLIASLGYPADYLEPVYTCKDCKDTGYIGNERCHCFVQAAIDLVYTAV